MEQVGAKKELRILMLEDTASDAELAEHELRKSGLVFTALRVDKRDAFEHALEEFHPDIILTDFRLPDFDGMTALHMVRHTHPEIPVIMVTGALNDIEAVDLLHSGAKDYVLKDRLARLGPSVKMVLSKERSIRARKLAEEALRKSEKAFRIMFESSRDAVMTINPEDGFLSGNPATVALFGCRDEQEFITLTPAMVSPEFQPDGRRSDEKAREMMHLALDKGSHFFEWTNRRMDGTEFFSNVLLTRMEIDGSQLLQSTVRDITERKRTELELQRVNRTLRTLSEGNRSLIRSTDETQLLHAICRTAVEKGGYRMAWVGYVGQDAERSIRAVAQEGFEEGYLEQAHITWADNERGQGPTGRAARSGQTQFAKNIAHDPSMMPWRMEAMRRGYASSIALPLLDKSRCFGVLTIYAAEADAFDTSEIMLLEEMADDLAFGILTLRIKLAHREHEQRLHKNMLQTVEAIAGIVEMRDPYTSGHQARVAELARAIARHMGLSEEEMQVVHLAGLVHDLGKISIPAEILSKPSRLNDIEYSLIKMHPQSGYDILKDIDFSWPIAQMVLQHHERMDGSGYPQGLKGEQILQGARILAVADVVEAMSSHRPYRPGLGINAALEEITRARGTSYDAQVVDACVALFREHGYELPT